LEARPKAKIFVATDAQSSLDYLIHNGLFAITRSTIAIGCDIRRHYPPCWAGGSCLRASMNGYHVGYSFVPFKGPPGHYSLDGGTMLFSAAARRKNQLRNQNKIYELYARHVRRINSLVAEANRGAATGIGDGSQQGASQPSNGELARKPTRR
jgi:hypothetical protein